MTLDKLKQKLEKIILRTMRDSLNLYNNLAYVQTLHQQTFGDYYNCNYGKNVVVIASGPTVKDYKPIPNAIHIGVNNTYKLKDKIHFKYMFMQDFNIGRESTIEILNMNCTKFIGKSISDTSLDTPEGLLANTDVKRYFVHPTTDIKGIKTLKIDPDIRYHTLLDFGTVVGPAIHFALFTNPKKIYLVGCDTNSNGHFDVNNKSKEDSILSQNAINQLKTGYIKIKEFAMHQYPDTEIISINPVGLKGIFIDEYY